jgi:hypothetical protein
MEQNISPKYELVISLAKSKFTPEDITELTLASITEKGEIKLDKKVHKLSPEDIVNLGLYLNRNDNTFANTKHLFFGKDKGKGHVSGLVVGTGRYLASKGATLESIGWTKPTKNKKQPPKTLEEIMAFTARYK